MSSNNNKRPTAVPIRPGIKITQPTTATKIVPNSTTTTSSSSSSTATKINPPTIAIIPPRSQAQAINIPSNNRNIPSTSRSSTAPPLSSQPIKSYSQYNEEEDEDDNEYDLPSNRNTKTTTSTTTDSRSTRTRNRQHQMEEEEDEEEEETVSTRTRRRNDSVSATSTTTTKTKPSTKSTAIVPTDNTGITTTTTGIVRPVAVTKYGIRQFVESQHGLRLFLQNCVASCDFKCSPDLAHIATHARNAEYNPQRFSAVILRLREPRSTALIFGSGKVVLTGARNEEDSLLGIRKICKILQALGCPASINGFRIQNMVATGDCGFPIRLEGLADEHSKFSSYEPELFPGLIYRMESPHIVFLIFVSGKVVITGARGRTAVIQGINALYPVLFKYRKAITGTM